MNLGRSIKSWRIRREMSQDQLAKAAGLSVSYLSLLEQANREFRETQGGQS